MKHLTAFTLTLLLLWPASASALEEHGWLMERQLELAQQPDPSDLSSMWMLPPIARSWVEKGADIRVAWAIVLVFGDNELPFRLCWGESDCQIDAVGDRGRSLGPWQMYDGTAPGFIAAEFPEIGEWWSEARTDPYASTVIACRWIERLGATQWTIARNFGIVDELNALVDGRDCRHGWALHPSTLGVQP